MVVLSDYVNRHNGNPQPFVGTAKAADILESLKRAHKVLNIAEFDRRTTCDGLARDTGSGRILRPAFP